MFARLQTIDEKHLQSLLEGAIFGGMSKPNQGSTSLAKLCRDGASRRAVAATCGVTEQAVRLWCEGRATPNYANRKRLADSYAIPIDAWDERTRKRAA